MFGNVRPVRAVLHTMHQAAAELQPTPLPYFNLQLRHRPQPRIENISIYKNHLRLSLSLSALLLSTFYLIFFICPFMKFSGSNAHRQKETKEL